MLHIQTPLLESRPLSLITGKRVHLKLEALQPSGSFKLRGIGRLCQSLKRDGIGRFVSSSGGNAGIAVAYAGCKLGVPVTVVVPRTASIRAREILDGLGADVRVHGASWNEANELAESLARQDGALVHPFDHPLLWEGYASLVDEMVASGLRPDAVTLSVGGGGLYSGVVEGLRRNGLTDVPVIAVETEGTASFHASISKGELVALDSIRGVATSLGAKKVAQHAFDLHRKHPTHSLVVSDGDAISGAVRFLDDHRLLVEPACGAALAPVYNNHEVLKPFNTVVCIVCGGATTTAEQLRSYQ
ncbi:MAG: pyridoxal-phosphate dependent enzyme [Pseudomonadota bacterium]|jgi:L-serine/L-threonine ammonia-lyase